MEGGVCRSHIAVLDENLEKSQEKNSTNLRGPTSGIERLVPFSTQESLRNPGSGSDNRSLLTNSLGDYLVLRWLLCNLIPES